MLAQSNPEPGRAQEITPFAGDAASWDASLDALAHVSAYQYHVFIGNDAEPVQLRSGDQVLAAGAVIRSPLLRLPRRVLSVHRGPAGDVPAALPALESWARNRGAWCLEVMPDLVHDEDLAAMMLKLDWQQVGPIRHTLRLDVRPDEERLLAGFDERGRYKLRRAQRDGISVAPATTPDDVAAFVTMHVEMSADKNLSGTPPEYLQRIATSVVIGGDRGSLLMARRDGEPLGGILLWRCGSRVEYLYGATRRKDTGLSANAGVGYLLQWEGIRWARAARAVEYDFGGFDPAATGGPAQMKRALCRNVVALSPRWRKVLRSLRYRTAERIRQRLRATFQGKQRD